MAAVDFWIPPETRYLGAWPDAVFPKSAAMAPMRW